MPLCAQLGGAVGTAGCLDGDGGKAMGAVLAGGFRGRFFFLAVHPVDKADEQKESKGHDDKVYQCIDEEAVVKCCRACGSGFLQRGVVLS